MTRSDAQGKAPRKLGLGLVIARWGEEGCYLFLACTHLVYSQSQLTESRSDAVHCTLNFPSFDIMINPFLFWTNHVANM